MPLISKESSQAIQFWLWEFFILTEHKEDNLWTTQENQKAAV